ncbi:MAG TPA: DUF302 domain-containing protein [bacterium]|nr:DUF302 domain-containing protein [bacterium]HPQ65731.1 DUF302 domain-containing protein [bacterium]
MNGYGFSKVLNLPFAEAEATATTALKAEGFGILSRIDLREKFEEKLGIDFKNYVILGACNPTNARKAILAEEEIGLLLPCNVVLYEKDGGTAVSFIRPTAAMRMIDNPELQKVASEVEGQLKRAFDSLS